MAGTHFTLTGSDQVKAKMMKAKDAVNKANSRIALRAGALVIQNAAKEGAPYRTGTLRRSIAIEDGPGEYEVSIGTDVEYAPYVEFGTVNMAARPYLRPALDEHLAEARSIIESTLWNLIDGAVG